MKKYPSTIEVKDSKEAKNPAIMLFGNRFFSDQTVMELLTELFLVCCSSKQIGENENEFGDYFPDLKTLRSWPEGATLQYARKIRLNLKLFAFLSSSRLETRHETHRQHCQELWDRMKGKIATEDSARKEEIILLLSNLFLGFWGTGSQRTWCSQSFLPFYEGVLGSEVVWKESKSKTVDSWETALNLFICSQHIILARGGEILYLQLCNALSQNVATIADFDKDLGLELSPEEKDPVQLHKNLSEALKSFFGRTPTILSDLSEWINTGLEDNTENALRNQRWTSCSWCPADSWREGYLFAVELCRLLNMNVDLMEMVELLQIACAMQVMRSLLAQSYRNGAAGQSDKHGFCYRMLFSAPNEANRRLKSLSIDSCKYVGLGIWHALRTSEIYKQVPEKNYIDADRRYGNKLFVKIGKSIGLIVPRAGSGARFILTDKILRFLLLTLVPGQRMSLDTFKNRVERHYGFVFDEERLKQSPDWQDKQERLSEHQPTPIYLEQMLDASGVLENLSDSCSLIKNPFSKEA